MAPGLAFRILAHLEELGLLEAGDLVLDPLCGIGTSLLVSCARGFASVGVELESEFVSLAQANADRLKAKGSPVAQWEDIIVAVRKDTPSPFVTPSGIRI